MKRIAFLLFVSILTILLCGVTAASPEKASHVSAPSTPSVRTERTAAAGGLTGKVVETMDAGGYTYVCLEKRGKKTWVAVPQMKVILGKEMSFQPGQTMTNFASKSLKRTFDAIIFSGGPMAEPSVAARNDLPPGHAPVGPAETNASGSKSQTAPKESNVKIDKAAGANAYTIAEIFKKRIELNKKQVAVRGKVVKVSEGIMGKNWLHLQDGSGDEQKGTHNLVVTTQGVSAVGEIVTIKGKMSKDKDFGAGYVYKVIIEDAKIEK